MTSLSEGRLEIEAFAAGAIIPVRKEYEGLIKGTCDIVYLPDGWWDAVQPASYMFSQYVGGPTGIQLMLWDLAGGGRELSHKMVKDVPVVFVGPLTVHPAEVWAQTNKRLDTVADLKGLKIRVGAATLAEIYKRLGAAPVVLSGAEIYESAKRGVIDAFEYVTPSTNYGMGFHEVTKYIYISPVRAPADRQSVWVTKPAWDRLTPALQDLLVKTAEALVPRFFAETIVLDAEALEKMKAYGNEILPVPRGIDEELLKVADGWMKEQAAKSPFFAEVWQSQRAYKEKCEMSNVQ